MAKHEVGPDGRSTALRGVVLPGAEGCPWGALPSPRCDAAVGRVLVVVQLPATPSHAWMGHSLMSAALAGVQETLPMYGAGTQAAQALLRRLQNQ
jgi:hypothetical protein